MGKLKRILSGMAISGMMALSILSLSPAATIAARTYTWNNNGPIAPMYPAPTTKSYVRAWMKNGHTFRMSCWVDFQWTKGNYWTNRWFFGQTYTTGSWGYVHASYVINQVWTPHC